MDADYAVTVVLGTFNRSTLVGPAIDALLRQSSTAPPYEVLVVDNNSTDDTRAVVESRITNASVPLRYIFEREQGASHARNTGIANARADIVAFTDDDVRVRADWVSVIKESFDAHPDVDCVGGRILPVWEARPPAWLTERHWVGPLALQDYGDVPFLVDANRPLCLASANLAIRRAVFDRIGGFLPTYARAEDSEFLLRYWRAGRPARYVPEMTVHAPVQAERLEKAYHRSWHVQTGSFARLAEELSAATDTARTAPGFARLLGVPVFAFRELGTEAFLWCVDTLRRRDADAFWHEGQIRELVAYMRESSALYRRSTRTSSGLRADSAPRA